MLFYIIMDAQKLLIYLFFMYFILLSADCSTLINVRIQKYIKNNMWIKHFLIFFSIYIFGFILKWFNFDDNIVDDDINNDKFTYDNNFNIIKTNYFWYIKYLFKTLFYSLFIYILFLISSKNTPLFFIIFIFLMIILILLYTYGESIDPTIFNIYMKYNIFNYKKLNNLNIKTIYKKYIKKNNLSDDENNRNFKNIDKNTKNIKILIIIINIIFIIIIITLLIGFYLYYKKQKINFKNKFNWIQFIFGSTNSIKKI